MNSQKVKLHGIYYSLIHSNTQINHCNIITTDRFTFKVFTFKAPIYFYCDKFVHSLYLISSNP